MVSNCQLYNGEHNDLSKKGLILWKMFRKGIAKVTESQKLKLSDDLEDNFGKPYYRDISEFSDNPQSSIANKKSGKELHSTVMRKKKKRIPAKAALDVLSQASEVAVKIYQSANSQSNDMLNVDKLGVRQAYSDLFPKLKVVPIHSHPQSLIDRFTSDSSSQDTGDCSNEDNSSIVNNDNNQQFVARVLDNSTSDETANNYYLGNDISSELSHFMDKNSSKPFNILSENEDDMDDASNNGSASIHENESTSSVGAINYTYPKSAPSASEGLVHGIANILEECNNDTVSNLISNLVKEPVYSTVNTSQSKVGHNLVHAPKQGSSLNIDSRNSPENNVSVPVDQNMTDDNIPFSRENLNIQPDLTSSSCYNEMSTVDASVLGISSQKFINKQNNVYNGPLSSSNVSDHQMNYVLSSKLQNNGNNCIPVAHAQGPLRSNSDAPEPNIRYSPSYLSEPTNSSQVYPEAVNNSEGNHDVQKTSSHQHLSTSANLAHSPNMLIPNNASSLLQVAPAITTVATSQIPVQMPSFYSKSSNQSSNLKPGLKQFPAMKVSLPPSTGEILVVPGTAPASSSMTFHLFAQPVSTQAQTIESHVKVHAVNSVSPIQAHYQGSAKVTENQVKSGNKRSKKDSSVYPPKKRSPVPEHQPSHSVPSQYSQLPYQPGLNARVSDVSVSLNTTRPCYTTSNSIPVNSYGTYSMDNSRQSVIRPSTIAASQSNGALNNSASTSTSNAISSSPGVFASRAESFVHNSPTYQTLCPKTLPVVFSSYNRMDRNELNAGSVMNITAGKQLDNQTHNNNSFVQNVFIPTNAQSLNMNSVIPNSSGQYVILSSPKDNTGKLYNRGQASTLQNSETSEIIASMPVLQPSNNLFQNFAFNGISVNQPQVFNQTTTNQVPQYVNVPTYMIANQNFGKPPVLNIQSQMVNNRRPVTMSYSGNA
ncbi:hypothetical protein X975_20435, partial [Stegodyphus mimosarum]